MNTALAQAVPCLSLVTTVVAVAALLLTLSVRRRLRRVPALLDERLANLERRLTERQHALIVLDRLAPTRSRLPQLGGWAMEADLLAEVAALVRRRRPKLVLECGSGTSTLVIGGILQALGDGHLVSLEADEGFARATRQATAAHDIDGSVTIALAPLRQVEVGDRVVPWYDPDLVRSALTGRPPIEILVVDGPPSTAAPHARHPALPLLAPFLAPDALIVVDDCDRTDDRETVERWCAEFPDLVRTDLAVSRGALLLRRTPTPVASVLDGGDDGIAPGGATGESGADEVAGQAPHHREAVAKERGKLVP